MGGSADLEHAWRAWLRPAYRGRRRGSTAAVAPEMTVWSGELRLAGETTAELGLKGSWTRVLFGSGVRSSEDLGADGLDRDPGREPPGWRPLRQLREGRLAACIGRGRERCGRRRRRKGSGDDVGGEYVAEGMAGGEGGLDVAVG